MWPPRANLLEQIPAGFKGRGEAWSLLSALGWACKGVWNPEWVLEDLFSWPSSLWETYVARFAWREQFGTWGESLQMLAGLLCGAYRKPAIFGALYKAWRTKVPSVSTDKFSCPQTRLVPAVDLHLTLPSQMKNCGQSHHVYLRGFLVAGAQVLLQGWCRCTLMRAG